MTLRLVPVDSGKTIKLDKPVLLVGRNPDCDVILLESRKVSRVHCLLACIERRVFIRDLGSTNGVWVNGHRVERESRMNVGDEISFADLKYELVTSDEPAPKPARKDDDESPPNKPKRAHQDGFDERATRDRNPPVKPAQVNKERLVVLPDEDDSFVVEPSLIDVRKPKAVDDDDDLPLLSDDDLPKIDDDDELPLANLLLEDDDSGADEVPSRKKRRHN